MSRATRERGGPGQVTFLHSADWQLGMARHFLSPEAQSRFSQARVDAIVRIGEVARETGAAFVVVGGDVFETNQVEPVTVRRTLEAIASVPVPVILLPGNHDPLDAATVYRSPTFLDRRPPNLRVLEDAAPVEILPGVDVVGAPWTSKRPLRDLVADACAGLAPDPARLRVLVGHGATDDLIAIDNPAAIGVRAVEAALADGRIAYLALGDRHSTTAVGSTGRIWYAGAPEPTDYDETDPGNVLVVELADGRCTVTPKRIATWRFVRERFELEGGVGVDEVDRWLDALPAKERTIVKLSLVGAISLTDDARLSTILEHHALLFGAIELWERHTDLVVRPDDDDFTDLGLSGFADVAFRRLREQADGSGEAADAARDALSLLVRFAR